jgi:ATP-binding cassette, subfamily B, bacterial PglK
VATCPASQHIERELGGEQDSLEWQTSQRLARSGGSPPERIPVRLFIQSIQRSFALIQPHPWHWTALLLLALATTAFEIMGAGLVYLLIGMVATPAAATTLPVVGDVTTVLPAVSENTLRLIVAGLVGGFFLIRAGVMVGQGYVRARLVENATARLSTRLVRGYLAMPYVFHTQHNSAELVRNAYVSTRQLGGSVLMPIVNITVEAVLTIGLLLALLALAPQAMLLAVGLVAGLVLTLLRIIQPRLHALGRSAQEAHGRSLQALQQALGGFRDIRLLGREEEFARSYGGQRLQLARAEYIRKALGELPRSLIETALVLVIVGVFVVAIVAGDDVETVLATLGIFAYAGLRLQPSVHKIVHGLNELRFNSALLDDLHADRLEIEAALQRSSERPTADTGDTFQQAIELRGVAFSYPEGGPAVLRDVHLTINEGEFVGVCGPTGGGKSTLIDLIAGLLEPTEGSVLVDGRPISEDPAWWHRQLGVVSQSVFLIDDTIRANIALGERSSGIDPERLARCVQRAQLQGVVAELPDGLDTVVGERGIRLSGGQRQRVAVARALYREPPIIILDEGTSALDNATEAALMAAIGDLRQNRTLIAVAHRLTTVKDADRIVVIQAGRVVADGDYEDLLQVNDLFRSLSQ